MQSVPPFLPINFLCQFHNPCLREAASAKAGEIPNAI